MNPGQPDRFEPVAIMEENQHYVNQAHLRGFTIAGEASLLWQYDKVTGRVAQRSVRRVCSRINYYAAWDKDGKTDNTTIERRFNSHIETPASRVIAGLRPDASGKIMIGPADKARVAVFIGTLMTRGPAFRDGIHDLHEGLAKRTLRLLMAQGKVPPMPPELMARVEEKGLWGTLNINIDSKVSIPPMIDVGAQIAQGLSAKAWSFLVPADGMAFVTSDNPVSFRRPDEITAAFGPIDVGPGHPLCELTVPLRNNLMLVCHPVPNRSTEELLASPSDVIPLTKDETHGANLRPIRAALRHVYAPVNTPEIRQQVAAMKGTRQRLASL